MKYQIIAFILLVFVTTGNAISCRAGRGACIASCMAQNCASGYCTSVPDGTCVCTRCSNGPPWPHG